MILIFSEENDLSTIEVAKRLRWYKKEFYIINATENIFKFERIDDKGIYFRHNNDDEIINLLDANACWWRRGGLGVYNFIDRSGRGNILNNKYLEVGEILFRPNGIIESETKVLRQYIFNRIYNTVKINLGSPNLFDLNRLEIIDIAKKHNLKTPYFEVISNVNLLSSNRIKDEFVSKAIGNGIYDIVNGKSYYTYTESHHKNKFQFKSVSIFPSLIMNLVEKKFEIRAFYIDGHFYSMAIFSQSNEQTKVDFRKYNSELPNRNEPFKLPVEIEKKLRLIFKEIGLNTGSVDLILDSDDEYVFLEINPVGQYGMTSEPCNYDLDNIIAKYLINGNVS